MLTTKSLFQCLVFLLVIFLCMPLYASSFYIDFDSGNDNNNGLSSQTAFKHCPGDTNATGVAGDINFKPGDVVYFKKGVIYDGQIALTNSGSQIVIGSTGVVTEGGIFTDLTQHFKDNGVLTGDYIYIFNNSEAGAYNESCGLWQIASVDSETQLSLSNFNGSPYNISELNYMIFRPITLTSKDGWGTGDATLRQGNTYIIRPDNVSYLRIAKLKFTNISRPNENDCENRNVNAIYDNHNTTCWVVEDCIFQHVNGAMWSDGSYNVIRNNIIDDWDSLAIVAGKYALVENNHLSTGMSGIRGCGKYSIVRFNTIIDANKASADYCGLHADAIGPFFSDSSDPGSNRFGWIYGNLIANTVMGIFLEYNNGGTSDWTIHSNVLIGYAGAGGSGSTAIMVRNAPRTKIYNNVIFGINGGHGWGNAIKLEHRAEYNPSIDCVIKNNIMYSLSTGAPAINFDSADDAKGAVVEGNIYYTPNRAAPFGYDGTHLTWDQWKEHGYDTASDAKFGIDPGFVDTSGTSWKDIDLRLSDTLPILRGHINVPFFSRDADKNYRLINSPWTKGAYERATSPSSTALEPPNNVRIIQ